MQNLQTLFKQDNRGRVLGDIDACGDRDAHIGCMQRVGLAGYPPELTPVSGQLDRGEKRDLPPVHDTGIANRLSFESRLKKQGQKDHM